MGYYIDPYVSVLAKASLASVSQANQTSEPWMIRSGEASGALKSTGWELNEGPVASRAAQHIMPPLINRGYYARVQAIRAALKHFISNLGGTQVVSFGAGFDSTYFLLCDEGFKMERYIEIDVIDTVLKKASAIRGAKKLFDKHLPNLVFERTGKVSSDVYHLAGCDLRDLTELELVLSSCGLDKGRPTLFLSECVLIYMTVEESGALIAWTREQFQQSYFVLYEQVEPHDNFGRAMLENLKARRCPLLSILAFPTIADQQKRFESLGWGYVEVWNMAEIYSKVVTRERAEKTRIDTLEFMDELEEWDLFNTHYFIAMASHHAMMAQTTMLTHPSPSTGDLKSDAILGDNQMAPQTSDGSLLESHDDSCRVQWKLRFQDLVVPVGPSKPASAGGRRLPFASSIRDIS